MSFIFLYFPRIFVNFPDHFHFSCIQYISFKYELCKGEKCETEISFLYLSGVVNGRTYVIKV